jgi:GDP-fucose protein O-fucosyltransferase
VIIKPEGGLANRLRVILSRLEPGLKVVWDPYDPIIAGERFTDVFEPLADVEFVDDGPFDLETCDAVDQFKRWWLDRYDLLHPVKHVALRIEEVCARLGDSFAAMHIRRTDVPTPGSRHSWCEEFTEDAAFISWAKTFTQEKIFLATDNRTTQLEMRSTLGPRLVWAEDITSNKIKWDQSRERATSLGAAVVDAWVAARSYAFMGTYGTSFSYLIHVLRERRMQGAK